MADQNVATSSPTQTAILAAGCFWGVQFYLDQIPGVIKSEVGYTGGHTTEPTYEQVCGHDTGHAEAVKVEFDPSQISYKTLLKHFFRLHDPTQLNRQGPDVGDNYRSAIFYLNDQQKNQAEAGLQAAQSNYQQPIVTQITAAQPFYLAEDFHQKFTQRTGHGACHVGYQPIPA
ncbi:MAG: peptide-methionine (S)-S-oxide reductase MsrA [Candidatus Saccharimonadales bacterium]